jgi:hypothetical protein
LVLTIVATPLIVVTYSLTTIVTPSDTVVIFPSSSKLVGAKAVELELSTRSGSDKDWVAVGDETEEIEVVQGA